MEMRSTFAGVLAVFLALPPATSQIPIAGAPDSADASAAGSVVHLVSRRQLAIGGAAILSTAVLVPLDRPIQHSLQAEDLQDNRGLRRVAGTLEFSGGPGPFVAAGALYVGGRVSGSARATDLGVHLAEGVTLAAALNGLFKGLTGRALPTASTREAGDFSFGRGFHDANGPFVSFPSGHTAASFAAAAVLTDELARSQPQAARVVGPLAYGAATLVGLARVYQNVHWASDLPVAAAIGAWSGKTVVAWQHAHSHNRLDRWLLGTIVVPNAHRGIGLGWSSVGQ